MSDTPEGWRRREDGILEPDPGIQRRAIHEEAVLNRDGSFQCRARVSSRDAWRMSNCANPAKHDPDKNGNPTKCGIHCKAAVEKRKAKSDAKHEEWLKRHDLNDQRRKIQAELEPIIRQIAGGHNDPRGLCSDWLKRRQELEDADYE